MPCKVQIEVKRQFASKSKEEVFEELIYKVLGVKCTLAEAPDVDDEKIQSIKERVQAYLDEKHRQSDEVK